MTEWPTYTEEFDEALDLVGADEVHRWLGEITSTQHERVPMFPPGPHLIQDIKDELRRRLDAAKETP